jgi:hypothetical protein
METNDSVISCPPCRSPEKCVTGVCAMVQEKLRLIHESWVTSQPRPACTPTQTVCFRCGNDIQKCDGMFAAKQPHAEESEK